MRAAFLDKDGTLVHDLPYNGDPDQMRLVPRAGEALRLLQQAGFRLIVVTNQDGIARGLLRPAQLDAMREHLIASLRVEDVQISGFYYCPHASTTACDCRKPRPGMLLQAAHEHGIALEDSWMVGDILNDIEAGRRAGCRTVLLDVGNETEWVMSELRRPDLVAPDLFGAAQAIFRAVTA